MKHASYREAIAWVALNDSAGEDDAQDPKACSELITAALVADIFGLSDEKVGRDIANYRAKHENNISR